MLLSLNYLVIQMVDRMTDEQFLEFSQLNEGFKIERTPKGKIVMAPTHSDTGFYNNEINIEFGIWNRKYKLGIVFDSSTGFRLPNGALRSPDLSWIAHESWKKLSPEDKKGFAKISPDFVLELRSSTDGLEMFKNKMLEYIANGTQLAWLIDRENKQVFVYRADGSIAIIPSFEEKVSGEKILLNFELDLKILNQEI